MATELKDKVEGTGGGFSAQAMLQARNKTWEAVQRIASRLKPGMTEEAGLALAVETLRDMGSGRMWHRPHVRFGPNTVKTYGSPSDPGMVLGEDDLFFVDIGPVFDGFEGDAGATFATGVDPERRRCIYDGRRLFHFVKDLWKREGLTGEALYGRAVDEAKRLGWELLLKEANGHRLSDFPHAIHFKGAIADLDFPPTAGLWVLEIQIRHPRLPFGSFHEDLLVETVPEDSLSKLP